MLNHYTRQSIPTNRYCELLGVALCVFNSNNAFIIETILRCDDSNKYNWFQLMDIESGKLRGSVHNVLVSKCGKDIDELFELLIRMRNRIVHSFRITNKSGEQVLATKERLEDGNSQFEITENYLLHFIKENERLCDMLHSLRGY